MKRLLPVLCLTIAELLGSVGVSWGKKDPILDKQSAIQMFALSSSEWVQNVANLKSTGIGKSVRNTNGTVTLIYRPDPQRGLLLVTPSYKANQANKPFKIDVGVILDRPLDRRLYETITFSETKDLLEDTANTMRPEFSVMGYLVRGQNKPPSLNFTIFQKGDFPSIDLIVSQGKVCPPRKGAQKCILEMAVGAPTDDKKLLDMCVAQIKGSFAGIGKSDSKVRSMCSCVSRMGKSGKSFEDATKRCVKE